MPPAAPGTLRLASSEAGSPQTAIRVMTPKTYVSRSAFPLLICALSLGATVQAAQAQSGQARDTTMRQADLPPNVNVIRGGQPLVPTGAVPADVRDVRRRIRNLGPGQRRVRVVRPVIMMPPSGPATAQVVGPDGVVRTVPAPGFTDNELDPRLLQLVEDNILRRIDTRFDELYDAFGRPNPRADQTRISFGDTTGVGLDSLALADTMALPDPVVAPPPVVEVDVEPEPRETTPRVVEREILDTGLFRAVDVNFEFNRSVLLPEAEPVLDAVGEVLVKYPTLQVEIGGHTDSIGPEAYNQRLSQARAQSVLDYLIGEFGVSPDRLTAVGYGESRPVASNTTPTGRTLNRRVEFNVVGVAGAEGRVISPTDPEARRDAILQEILRELRRLQAAPQNQN